MHARRLLPHCSRPLNGSDCKVHTPFAQLQIYWESILSHQFDQTDLIDFLAKVHLELPNDCLVREIGRIANVEIEKPHLDQQQILLGNAEDWDTTTRIDGILPFQVPQVRDIESVSNQLIRAAVPIGFDMPGPDIVDPVSYTHLTLPTMFEV